MRVIIALDNVIKTYTFPEDSDIYFNTPHGMIQIKPKATNRHHWFNTAYVIAIMPGFGDQ